MHPKPDPERDKQDESNSFPYLGTCSGGIKKMEFLEPLSTKGEPPLFMEGKIGSGNRALPK